MKSQKGFTIIELLVIIAIIGLISSVLIVALQDSRKDARNAIRLSNIEQFKTSLDSYYNDNNNYPDTGGTYKCLAQSTETCWKGSYAGDDALVASMKNYIRSIPKNLSSEGTWAHDSIVYFNSIGIPNSYYIYSWMYEGPMPDGVCTTSTISSPVTHNPKTYYAPGAIDPDYSFCRESKYY